MAIVILEKNGVEQTNLDGGAFNNFAAGGRSGIIQGVLGECTVTQPSSNSVAVSTGELIISGIRVKLTEQLLFTFTTTPAVPIRYQLVAKVSVSADGNVTFETDVREVASLVQDDIYKFGQGTYEVEIARFTHAEDGVTDLVRTIDIITGGVGSSTTGSINIGDVTTNTLDPGMEAEVDVESRYDEEQQKQVVDFQFAVPAGPQGERGTAIFVTTISGLSNVTLNTTVGISKSSFSSSPEVNDKVFAVFQQTETLTIYFTICNVDSIQDQTVNITINALRSITGPKGDPGADGTTFTPSVDASGNLSWTNDGDKENPPTVNIKGLQGDTGKDALVPNDIFYVDTYPFAGQTVTFNVSDFNRAPVQGDTFVCYESGTAGSAYADYKWIVLMEVVSLIGAGQITAEVEYAIRINGQDGAPGPKGDKGDQGEPGPKGDKGEPSPGIQNIEIKEMSFGNMSWSEISEISESGQASKYFAVGDEKTIELTTSEQVTLVILGFNHDDLTSGGKAGMSIGMKDLLAKTYTMGSSDTNKGGWNKNEMRTSTMATLLSQLPSDLQSVIKQVNKKATAGAGSTSITTSADKLWLLAEVEVDGTAEVVYADEGEQYEYWKTVKDGTVSDDRKKHRPNGNGGGFGDYWWLRSSHIRLGNTYYYINAAGGVSNGPTSMTNGVSFCFCV